ncbi:hypothetical protein SAMN06269185_1993 [Natronoarchaeum philippinense]|uniref:Uncharacterized protein n=1 Tax=Natronoarchaeum philippinense TaxID=558529 RepID=A0A285NZ86_NATPI|nr:hypothetical protein [Natronoarchaeum philippinense]SNZ12951.1 hypothetical protein SAMN06269185_1993 [Natronoarchaeum philippinense]
MKWRETDAGPRVRLAEDDRARVPFALLGVLLLVGSVTWTVALSARGPPQVDADAGPAIDRAESVVRTELRQAVERAGANAASAPVVERANNTFGQVLDAETPYRDAFRIRIYQQAVAALADTEASVGGVRVDADLQPITNASTMRDALDRVRLVDRGVGVVGVEVENVSLEATVRGRTIERTERSVTVSVATPALALHERATRFETQLDRGALAGPGFGRRLAARLYAITWARGYAQYGGAPIENVLANRHVELSANSALLQTQRAAIGTSDPAGRAAMGRAAARVGTTDLLAGAGYDGERWLDAVLGDQTVPVDGGGQIAEPAAEAGQPAAGRSETTVGVNRSAVVALDALSTGRDGDSLDEIVDDLYEANVERVVDVERTDSNESVAPARPGPDWWETDESVTKTITEVSANDRPTPSGPYGWDEYAAHARTVTREHVATTRWIARNGSTRTTSANWTTTHHVGIAVVGNPARSARVPEHRIERLYEPGGPAESRNLDGVPEEAVDRLLDAAGGPDAAARAAVRGDLDDRKITVGRPPAPTVRDWIYRDLVELRETARDISVTVDRGRLATGVNPAAELEAKLRARRNAETDRYQSYESVADKARAAARVAYLNRLVDDLDAAAEDVEATQNGVESSLDGAGAAPIGNLDSLLSLRNDVQAAEPRSTAAAPPADSIRLSVDGTPAYLTLASITNSDLSTLPANATYHPLVAETANLFADPANPVPAAVTDSALGDVETVGLRRSARALAAADGVASLSGSDGAGASRRQLREELVSSNRVLRGKALGVLGEQTSLPYHYRTAIIDGALNEWDSPSARAIALVDGSAAAAVARVAAKRDDTPSTPAFRDRLRSRLLVTLSDAASGETVRLPDSAVGTVVEETRRQAKVMAQDAVKRQQQRLRTKLATNASKMPAGFPVTPVPGYWYATANVWTVELAGKYATFRIDARQGTPVAGGAVGGTTSYVRDGDSVKLDLTGDGIPETIGRSTRVAFRADTTVLVVVPAGKSGVGDVGGSPTERSGGWPDPGFVDGAPDDAAMPAPETPSGNA